MNVNGMNAMQKLAKTENKKGTLRCWLDERKGDLMSAIPKGTVEVDRFMQSATLALTNPKTPELLKCDKDSIARALKEAASYGLELNGTLGQAYLIPYNENVKDKNGNWSKVMTCHFQMGYKGLIALARRSNTIKTIAAECIYENDEFDCELASGRSIHHRMNIFAERGEVIGYYCLVELTNGGEQFAVMSKKDAEKFRDTYSKSYIMAKDKSTQNWGKNFDAMALKTCVIKALKLCPISIEALEAVGKEEMKDIEPDTVEFEDSEETKSEPRIASRQAKKAAVTVDVQQPADAAQNQKQTAQQQNQAQAMSPTSSELAMGALSPEDEAGMDAAFDGQMQFGDGAIF